VGIGTASPAAKLEVNGGVRLNTTAQKPACDLSTAGTLWFSKGPKDVVELCSGSSIYPPIQAWSSSPGWYGWATKGPDNTILARRYRAISTFRLGMISLFLAKDSSVGGNFYVTLETGDSAPSAVVSASGNNATNVPNYGGSGWVNFTFSDPPQLSAGSDYWIVLRSRDLTPGQYANPYVGTFYSSLDPSPGISLYRSYNSPASWSSMSPYSIPYKTFSDVRPFSWRGFGGEKTALTTSVNLGPTGCGQQYKELVIVNGAVVNVISHTGFCG
jgi:hypothetical protein